MNESRRKIHKWYLEVILLIAVLELSNGAANPYASLSKINTDPCEVGEWSSWSEVDCKSKQVKRSRKVVRGNADECTEKLEETKHVPAPVVSKWSDWREPGNNGIKVRTRTATGYCLKEFLGPDFSLVEKKSENKATTPKITNTESYEDYVKENAGSRTRGHKERKAIAIQNVIARIAGVKIVSNHNYSTEESPEVKKPKAKAVYNKYLIQNPRPLMNYFLIPSYRAYNGPSPKVLKAHYKKSAIMNDISEVITTTVSPTTEKTYWNSNGFLDYREEYNKWYNQILREIIKNQTKGGITDDGMALLSNKYGINPLLVRRHHNFGSEQPASIRDTRIHSDTSNTHIEKSKNIAPILPGTHGFGSPNGVPEDQSYSNADQTPNGSYGGMFGGSNHHVSAGGSYSSPIGSSSSYSSQISSTGSSGLDSYDAQLGGTGVKAPGISASKIPGISNSKISFNTALSRLANYSAAHDEEDEKRRKEYLKSKKDFSDIFSILEDQNDFQDNDNGMKFSHEPDPFESNTHFERHVINNGQTNQGYEPQNNPQGSYTDYGSQNYGQGSYPDYGSSNYAHSAYPDYGSSNYAQGPYIDYDSLNYAHRPYRDYDYSEGFPNDPMSDAGASYNDAISNPGDMNNNPYADTAFNPQSQIPSAATDSYSPTGISPKSDQYSAGQHIQSASNMNPSSAGSGYIPPYAEVPYGETIGSSGTYGGQQPYSPPGDGFSANAPPPYNSAAQNNDPVSQTNVASKGNFRDIFSILENNEHLRAEDLGLFHGNDDTTDTDSPSANNNM